MLGQVIDQSQSPRSIFNMLHFARIIGLLGTLLISAQVLAVGLGDLSGKEASAGLKEALSRGADMAVSQLGKPNGFMGDARVRIPLPKSLRAAEKMMRTLGMKKQAEELIETMNRAAELAVVEAKPILLESVQKMTIDDARGILAGGDDAATQYFRRTTSTALGKKFLPIVKQATAKVQLADQYNEYAGQAAKLGLLEEKDANLDSYVTQKALDGLFVMIAEQEKSIRQDPVGTGSKLLQTVFGAVGK
jgi:hypothetical protein